MNRIKENAFVIKLSVVALSSIIILIVIKSGLLESVVKEKINEQVQEVKVKVEQKVEEKKNKVESEIKKVKDSFEDKKKELEDKVKDKLMDIGF